MTLAADLKALQDDATTWDDASGDLGKAGGNAAGLYLGTSELSWAADVVGLTEVYTSFVSTVSERLGQGADSTSDIGSALLKIKSAYESTDHHARNKLKGLWDPA